jgi:hypothetical protein
MGGSADLIGEGRDAERHAFAGKPLSLAVEGLVLSLLLEQEHGEEAGAGPCRVALALLMARPSGVFGPVLRWALRRFASICLRLVMGAKDHAVRRT